MWNTYMLALRSDYDKVMTVNVIQFELVPASHTDHITGIFNN